MTYLEAAEKVYDYYFNESKNNEEVILYIDDQILIEIFGDEGVNLFLNLFLEIPKNLLKESGINPKNYIKKIEELSELFLNKKNLFLKYVNSSSEIKTKAINPTSIEYNKCILLLILLVIYAENTDKGVFLQPNEKMIVGKEQIIRENVSELLKYLSDIFIKEPKNGYFKAINLYGEGKKNYKYVGYFKYHTPLRRDQFKQIVDIKNRHGFHYEIKDANQIELIFEDVLNSRFKNLRRLGYDIINKVISGTYNINLSSKSQQILKSTNRSDNNAIYVKPSIFIDINGKISKLLRVHCEGGGYQITLNIDGKENSVDLIQSPRYKSIEVDDWPSEIKINDSKINIFTINYENPENTFFIPINLNDIWNNIKRNEYISSAFSIANHPCYFLSKDQNKLNSLYQKSVNTVWIKLENYDYYKTEICKTNIFIQTNGFKSKEAQNNVSLINILDDNFYIKKYGNRWSYPYYFLPKIAVNKRPDENFYYKLNNSPEVQIDQTNFESNQLFFDLNSIQNLCPGILKLYLKNESQEIIEVLEKTIELLNEHDQISGVNPINYPSRNNRWREIDHTKVDVETFEDSVLTRILYTLSNYKEITLTNIFIYKIIDIILRRFNSEDLLNSYLDKMNIIRDLLALGFITKNEEEYKIGDLALVQTNYKKNNFRLSGSRNLPFLKKIISVAQNKDIEVRIFQNKNSELQRLLLPYEIYFTFLDRNQFETFLNMEIDGIKLFNFVKTIPYQEKIFDNLTITNVTEIYQYQQDLPIYLNSIEFDDENYSVIIEGKKKLIREKNGESKYLHSKIERIGEKYFKIKNDDLAIVNALTQNEIPFIFSKDHKGRESEYGYILTPCNYPYKIPQEFYSNLVYINGGLPDKIKLKASCYVSVLDENGKLKALDDKRLGDLILPNSKKINDEIEFYCYNNISATNSTKQDLVKQLNTVLHYIKY